MTNWNTPSAIALQWENMPVYQIAASIKNGLVNQQIQSQLHLCLKGLFFMRQTQEWNFYIMIAHGGKICDCELLLKLFRPFLVGVNHQVLHLVCHQVIVLACRQVNRLAKVHRLHRQENKFNISCSASLQKCEKGRRKEVLKCLTKIIPITFLEPIAPTIRIPALRLSQTMMVP